MMHRRCNISVQWKAALPRPRDTITLCLDPGFTIDIPFIIATLASLSILILIAKKQSLRVKSYCQKVSILISDFQHCQFFPTFQVLTALDIAGRELGFVHGDMRIANIMEHRPRDDAQACVMCSDRILTQ